MMSSSKTTVLNNLDNIPGEPTSDYMMLDMSFLPQHSSVGLIS